MSKYYCIFSEGSKINQIICAILINLPVFSYSTSIGWMSPMSLLLQSANSPRGEPLTDTEVSWMAAVPYLVSIPSYYVFAYLANTIGRKRTVLIISASSAILWIIKLSSFKTWALLTARSLVGVTMGGCYVACPVYTKEISHDSIRGLLGSLITVFHLAGNLFLLIIGDLCSYRTVLWICVTFPVLHLFIFLIIPESPSYLIKNGNAGEAAKVLAWLRCRKENDKNIQKELDELQKQQEHDERSKKHVYKEIFRDEILRKAFYIAVVICLARELCGITIVFNFSATIFSFASRGHFLSPNQQAILLGVVQFLGAVTASGAIEKTGRKPLLIITSLTSGISLFALASWFLARKYEVHAPEWLPAIILCVCILSDAAGLMPLSIVVTGEIFSYKYRGTVLATTMAIASVADFIQLLLFKPITSCIGAHYIYYFCGIVCFFNMMFVVFKLPETKNRTLKEIYNDMSKVKQMTEMSTSDSAHLHLNDSQM